MQKIPLARAAAGMVLAKEVFRGDNPVGMPICGKGTSLTESLIARFEHLDIQSIYVEGHPVWEDGDTTLDDILRALDHRFKKVGDDPLTEKLHQVYREYLTAAMGEDSGRQA